MYEELLLDSNTVIRTTNDKIFIEKNNNGYESITKKIEELRENIDLIDPIIFLSENVRSFKH